MMMHKGMLWLAVVAVAGALTLATPARAQDTETQGFTVSVGALYPTDKDTRNATQDFWFYVDLTYTFQTSEPTESGFYYDLGALVGFYGTGDSRVIPVGLSFTGYLNEQFFYRATAGVGFADNGDSETGFAWSIGFGYNFSTGATPLALCVGYNGFSGKGGDFNGITATLQFRF
ncbi:MAG: hypothetical protein NZL85_09280 [Fimbriimonadales bacterium]|nr:hypothetical protein [Fimbriimonadales bacterium]